MRMKVLSMALAGLALAGCKDEAPAPEPLPAATPSTSASAEIAGPQINVLAFGDSLFAGYGLAKPELSYPARLEEALRQGGRNVKIVNAGVSGDTTAAGRQRFTFTLDAQVQKPDLVLLELGGNDLLRGLPPEQTRQNLDAMLAELKARGIPVALFSLQAPPNYGAKWQAQFDGTYGALAAKYGVPLVPFVTEKVFAKPDLLQPDRVHPTAKGVEVLVADTLAAVTLALPAGD